MPLTDVDCQTCSRKLGYRVRKLQLFFNLSKSPRGIAPEVIACPSCDRIWEDIHIAALKLEPMGGHAGGGGGGGGMGGGGGGGGGGGQGRNGPFNAPSTSTSMSAAGRGTGAVTLPGRAPVRHQEYPIPTDQGGRSGYPIETSDYSAAATGVNLQNGPRAGGRGSSGGRSGGGAGRGGYNTASSDENAPVCECGVKTISVVTVKDGPNKGRPFYKCAKPR